MIAILSSGISAIAGVFCFHQWYSVDIFFGDWQIPVVTSGVAISQKLINILHSWFFQ
jgi:hypothetical protein